MSNENRPPNQPNMLPIVLHGCEVRKYNDGTGRVEVLVPVRALQPEEEGVLKDLFPNFGDKVRRILAQEALLERMDG